jgi:hypothetical protein
MIIFSFNEVATFNASILSFDEVKVTIGLRERGGLTIPKSDWYKYFNMHRWTRNGSVGVKARGRPASNPNADKYNFGLCIT